MIEPHVFGPVDIVVALLTVFAELLFVCIVFLVAGITVRFQLDLMNRLDMTVRAAEIGMRAQ